MRALLLSIALIIMSALPALAVDVLILQSSRNQTYSEAVAGFQQECRRSSRTVVLSDYAEVDAGRLVREERPLLVLAVGDDALAAVRKSAGRVPVVSVMALGSMATRASNISCVAPVAAPEQYLKLAKQMGRRRIGIITNTSRTEAYLRQARQAAADLGILLVVKDADSPRDLLMRLPQLKGQVDALWMLPDISVVTADTTEAMVRFSMEEQVPLISFAEQYVTRGAVAALQLDRRDMGRQAGEVAIAIISGEASPGVIGYPRHTTLRTNGSVAEKLGVSLPQVKLQQF